MTVTYATTEAVAVAWVKSLGLTGVGTTVPEDSSTWHSTGFVQVIKTGGAPDPYLKFRNNVITCDIWAAREDVNSQNPPWGQAAEIAETIVAGCYDVSKSNVGLILPASLNSIPVKVSSVWLITDSTRAPSDEAHKAHYLLDFQITWVQVPTS